MYAIIESGGKQHRVSPGDILEVEKIDAEIGGTVDLGPALLVSDGDALAIGDPVVPGSKVTAEIVAQGRSRKVIVFKKKRRKNYIRTNGHRQAFSRIKITAIAAG